MKKKKKIVFRCQGPHTFASVEQTEKGIKRTCAICGFHITDVAAGKFGSLSLHKTSKGDSLV